MKTIHIAAAVAVAVAGLTNAGTAGAVTQFRAFYSNPTGVCQGALPAYEGQIRKRPLALVNEGAATSFVTCNFTSQGGGGLTSVRVYFNSISDAAPITITCTGVSGFQNGSNQYITKTASAPVSGGQVSMLWSAADFTGAPANFPSSFFGISCQLPPGAAINDTYVNFSEDVGE